jgi:hypothetical protein
MHSTPTSIRARTGLCPSVPYYRNPQFRPGLAALVELLMDRNYNSHAIGRIFDFVACNGTLEGSLVEEEDMAAAESAFVAALPEVPYGSSAWGSVDEPAAEPGQEADPDSDDDLVGLPEPPLGPPDEWSADGQDESESPTREFPASPVEPPDSWPGGAAAGWALAPIAGGAPAFEPSAEDWADLRAWAETIDRLDAFNAARDDA